MHIQKLTISNILGIEHLELDAGQYNLISGRNGQGKTSILEAIKETLKAGHDATLLRKGAEQGEVVLVLDDGTSVRRRVKAEKSDTQVKVDGKLAAKPVDLLRQLADLTSINPVAFLRAGKKERATVLLETMPLRADEDKLAELACVQLEMPEGTHALQVIEAYRKQVYDDRTGTNRAVREKESTINQLQAAMPDAPGGVEGSEDELREQVNAAAKVRDDKLGKITTKLTGIQETGRETIQSINDKLAADIEALRQAAQKEIEAARATVAENETKAAAARAKANDDYSAATTPLNAAIAAIVANRDAAAKRQATLETIKRMEQELDDLQQDAARQTEALDAIDEYKGDLLASLPVPGLEVRDGDIYRDGVQFDRLNTAQQVGIAIEIAKLRAGKLGVICLDGAELLDEESLQSIKEQAADSGLQLFVSRVNNEEMQIISE